MTERRCFALDLKDDPDLIARYRATHAPGAVWPEITESIRAAGVEALEIHLVGNRMFMIMETGPGFSAEAKAAADAADPRVQQWEDFMWTFQQALPWAEPGQKWVPLERIYSLEEQP